MPITKYKNIHCKYCRRRAMSFGMCFKHYGRYVRRRKNYPTYSHDRLVQPSEFSMNVVSNPETYGKAVDMRIQGWETKEIAEKLDIKRNSLIKHLRQALGTYESQKKKYLRKKCILCYRHIYTKEMCRIHYGRYDNVVRRQGKFDDASIHDMQILMRRIPRRKDRVPGKW